MFLGNPHLQKMLLDIEAAVEEMTKYNTNIRKSVCANKSVLFLFCEHYVKSL